MADKGFGPLAGVTVIELCQQMAGPTCGLMLADMGADVIKIEKINGGDDTRRSVPPSIEGESSAFMMMNRNKRGMVLDFKSDAGKTAFLHLVKNADIVIENFRPGVMDRLGLGWPQLKEANPGLVFGSISGFGQTGPYSARRGFDLVAQGMSGLMTITGDRPDGPPVKVGAPICDITSGILLALGVVSAYTHKLKTGEGQYVETSLFEAGITHTYWQSAIAFATGVAPRAMGSAHPLNAPYQAVRTSDGHINIGPNGDKLWRAMLAAIGAPELADDPRFVANGDRMEHLSDLVYELEARFTTKTSAEWLDILEEAGVPAGPILDVIEMHNDPHAQDRQMVPEVDHPVARRVKTLGLPLKFSETPGRVATPSPLFGQHTREVLAEFGYAAEEIDRLVETGAAIAGDDHKEAAE